MRTTRWLGIALMVSVAACHAASDDAESSEAAATEAKPLDPYDYDTWEWKQGKPSCELGRVGKNIASAVKGARHNLDIMPGGKNDPRWVTTRNVAGPALLDGNEMYPALRTLISRAQHEVDLQWHVIDADSDGFDEVVKGIKALNAKLTSGETKGPVTVRIVSPAWIFRGGSTELFAQKIQAQVPTLSPKLTIKIASKKYFGLACMHVKMAVIDGAIVHAGGGNLSNAQNFKRLRSTGEMVSDAKFKELHKQTALLLRPGQPTTWDAVRELPLKRPEHDSAYVVKGQVAGAALAEFDQLWNEGSTSVTDCTVMWTNGANKCKSITDKLSPDVATPGGHEEAVIHPNLDDYGVPANACIPMVFMAKKATENVFNLGGNNPIAKGIYAAFDSAQKTLKVSSPNINDKAMLVLRSAAARFKRAGTGTVRVLEPIDFNWQVELMPYFGGGDNITNMLALKLLTGADNMGPNKALDYRWHSLDGVKAHHGWGKEIGRHIKYYSVDGEVVIIGSTNLDKQSMHRSREIAIAVDDAEVTKLWDSKIYDPDFSIGAKTYDYVDDGEAGKNAEPLETQAPAIEQTDDSDHNEETGEAKDGPSNAATESSLADD